tara:strand:- start:787 stop:966 length:180 start_codon:yes stop_codon:yes gene_type:complete
MPTKIISKELIEDLMNVQIGTSTASNLGMDDDQMNDLFADVLHKVGVSFEEYLELSEDL